MYLHQNYAVMILSIKSNYAQQAIV
ncbi:UNVERIFIED_CONTAM: hypothetical protein GTU68_027112 [Idotea baltica]|nr:hypothetical protein [Idotea baltica]